MRPPLQLLVALTLPLVGCNENTGLGNDREAQVDPAPTPSPIVSADAALENVATALVKPETMSAADISSIGGLGGACAIRLTEVAYPSFVYRPGEAGTIKLNGKLIRLPAAGENRFGDSKLIVALRPKGGEGDAGLEGMDMILVPSGAKDELGYSGFVDCDHGEAR